jgi:hypothetical protein
MKILITKAIICITAITLTFNAKAQTDYVITVKGDSIACKVSTPLIGGPKYKSDAMNKSEKIKPDEIKEYFIARKNLLTRSVFVDDAPDSQFLTVIEKGKISLFELVNSVYNGMSTTTTTTWYAGKGTDHVSALKTSALFFNKGRQQRRDNFAEMVADNKDVYDKYKAEDKFSFKQIRNLVHLYNTGKPFEEVEDKPKEDHSADFNPSQN